MSALEFIGRSPKRQMQEVKRFVYIMDQFKFRIFSTESKTFQNLMSSLNKTSLYGQNREDKTVKILKGLFGEENVFKVGKLGSSEDAYGGVDAEVIIDGKKLTAQIKPFTNFVIEQNNYTIFGTANVIKYKTDWLIFTDIKGGMLIFNNSNTKIVNGNYRIPESELFKKID